MWRYPLKILLLILCLGEVAAHGQVTAGFTASDTAGCTSLIVRFANTSTGATSYSWDLGNGTASSLTDAAASYSSAGTYTVTLTAHNGGSASTYSMIIRIYGKPTINFSANDTTVCENAPITFTSTSTSNAWGGITYIWNFGDGSSSTAATPTYSYSSPGFYNVTLFATNVKGCSNSFTRNSYINVFTPPAPIFSAATTGFCSAPGTVAFINATTGKTPIAYTWTFGDGSVSTATSPTYTYTAPAMFDVKLIVKDGNGCVDSFLQLKYITVGDLKAGFSSAPDGCLFTPLTFKNASSPHISSEWYFGDGSASNSDTAIHSYSAPGTYTVKLVVYDGSCYDSVTHTITIPTPTGSFTISQPCTPYSTETFTATVPAGITVAWSFGDDSMGTGNTITHTYHPPVLFPIPPPNPDPVYNITMTFTNSLGCKDTVKAIDTIKNLIISLSSGDSSGGCLPFVANFSLKAIYNIINPYPPCMACVLLTLPYPYAVTSYLWDFGDGSPTSSSAAPTHTYGTPGVYFATCHITTANGCNAVNSYKIKVGTKQTASFTMSKTHACAGQPIFYTSTSTSAALIDGYIWDFGDDEPPGGTYSTITHRSELPGIHISRLKVEYNSCLSNSDSMVDTIDMSNATIANTYTCIPDNGMYFADSAIGDDAHLWQFGDGDTSTAKDVVHFYPVLGSYLVTLTTYNIATGCRDTGSILIELQRLSPPITAFYLAICRDVVDTFSTIISTTDSTYPVKSLWYDNGSLTDTHVPIALIDPPVPPFVDTIYHPMYITGNNNITLIITDNHGCLDTVSKIIPVAQPTDSFSFTPVTTCPATAVNFTDHSTDVPGVSITGYYWSFGDGSFSASGIPTVSHTYSAAGTYTVKETINDSLGCFDTLTGTSHPLIHKPVAGFIAGSTYNCQGTTINFNNTSTGGISYLWVFGDGATSTLDLPSHIYTTAGTYTVQLIAFDAYGCTDTLTKNNLININPVPIASFYMDDSFAVCPPLNVNFINTSIGGPFFHWTFGDGNSSVSLYPSDIYTAPGVYRVKLQVSNTFGCVDTAIGHATVFGSVGGFSYTPSSACASLPVHFSATVSGVASVVWDFNDGYISLPSLSDTISHTYMTPGAYLPTLILTDFSGCSSSSLGVVPIKVDTVIAKFGAMPDPVCQNSGATFHDSSFSKFSAPAAWLWTFGPGATSTAGVPVYTYTVSGTKPVTLFVTDSFGCTGSVTKNILVNPVPAAIVGAADICSGQSTALSDITTGGIWSSSNTSVAAIGSGAGLVTSVAAGTSTIAYTLATGCKATITETVDPLPAAITGVKAVCAGAILSLSDPTPGGTWSSGNTAIAIIGSGTGMVTDIVAGTTTITYQIPTGCIATAIVKVDSSPVTIFGPSALCLGNTINVSDAVGGGNWSAGNTSVAIIGIVTGLLTGISAGTTTITYVLSTGCKTTLTVTTNPLPSLITGAASVCAGLTTTLSDATAGGNWSSSSTITATVSIGIVTGIKTGTTTITYALPTGCVATESLTINPLPAAITGTGNVCEKQTTTFSDPTPGGTWSSPYPSVVIGTSIGIATGISTGTATITYTLVTGCIVTKSVTVDPVPTNITGTKNICLGLTTTLSDATTGGAWSSPDISVIIGGTGIAKGMILGTATISYTLSTGCYTLTTVTVDPIPSPITGATHICAGSETSFSDSSGGGVWGSSTLSVASVDGAGSVTGITAGTATITFTSGVGCIAMITVTVYPVITPITGKNVLCKGTTITLSDAISGGAWGSSNNAIASINASGLVSGLATGSTIISYYVANTCDTATATIVVDPLPDAGTITGDTKICTGTLEILNDSVKGGMWTSDDSSIATVNSSGSVTGMATGIANITYSFTNSCGTAKVGVALSVNQTPAITHITTHPDSILCANTLFQNFGTDTAELPGITYTWNAENAVIYATAANKQYCLVSFNAPGTGIIKLLTESATSGCVSTDSLIFSISTDQSPDPTVVYYAPEFVCNDNTADNFQWGYDDVHTLDSSLLAQEVNQNYYNPDPDFSNRNYWVMTYHNGCLQKSYYNVPTQVNAVASGNNLEILLFPNPADTKINMEVKGINPSDMIVVQLYDMIGREIKVCTVDGGKGNMKIAELPSAAYMLVFSKNGLKIGSKTFVKN